MPAETVQAALELTRRQLGFLHEQDTDAFLEGLAEQVAACEAAAALPTEGVSPELRELFDQLVSACMALSLALDDALDGTRNRMATIQRGRSASAAYFDSQLPAQPRARSV